MKGKQKKQPKQPILSTVDQNVLSQLVDKAEEMVRVSAGVGDAAFELACLILFLQVMAPDLLDKSSWFANTLRGERERRKAQNA